MPPLDASGTKFLDGRYPVEYYVSYEPLRDLLDKEGASVMSDDDSGNAPIVKIPEPPYTALYSDPATRTVKTVLELTKDDINELVGFFLQLGGFQWDTNATVAPFTNKVERFGDWTVTFPPCAPVVPACTGQVNYPDAPPYSSHYPLTRNLARVLVLRRLLEADDFLAANSISSWGDVVVSRIHSFEGTQRWPAVLGEVEPCEGGLIGGKVHNQKAVRRVGGAVDGPVEYGFQSRIWAGGGGTDPLLALFPANGGNPDSYFLTFPGNRVSAFESPHFVDHMPEFVNGDLKPTHYHDYATNLCTHANEPWGANGVNPWPGVNVGSGNPFWITHP